MVVYRVCRELWVDCRQCNNCILYSAHAACDRRTTYSDHSTNQYTSTYCSPIYHTNRLLRIAPAAALPTRGIAFGDIKIQEIFLSGGGEVVVRVAVDPSSSLTGNFQYKVWVDGSLEATNTAALPAGSQAFYSGVVLVPVIFGPNKVITVKVDTANAIAETNEGNNDLSVTCTTFPLVCP